MRRLPLLHVLPFRAFCLAVPVLAQQELLSDPEIYEKNFFQKQCKVAEFGPDFISRIDINNDGLIDAVTNRGALTCDGHKSTTCNDDGCPYNFYVQVKEGGYLLIATATIYGYDFIQRFGNMVFVLKCIRAIASALTARRVK